MSKKVAIYAWCPVDKVRAEREALLMTAYIEANGYELIDTYMDQEKPLRNKFTKEQERIIADCQNGRIELILVYSFKRFTPSTSMIIFKRMLLMDSMGIDFKIFKCPLMDSTVSEEHKKHVIQFLQAMVNNDQHIFQSRMLSPRLIGKKLGRPAIPLEVKERLMELLAEKRSKQEIAQLLNIKLSTVKKYAQLLKEQTGTNNITPLL